jgi:hypothetical protein
MSSVIRPVSGSVDEQSNKVSVMLARSAVMLQNFFSHGTLAGKCKTETFNQISLVDTRKKLVSDVKNSH